MAAPIEDSDNLLIFVHDRRTEASPEVKLSLSGIQSYLAFRDKIKEVLKIDSDDFVIATTSREEIKDQESFEFIENGDTFYILKEVTQELCAPTHERVDYLPHYDTIVKGGMYEYYASEGQNPLPYAFAELIDNSIAATVLNDGPRQIELRLYLDDAAVNKNCIVVIDNGKGMTPRQLNNWAIYRLSKFTRQEKRLSQGKKNSKSNPDIEITEQKIVDDSLSPAGTWAPKFMNSDISYFGVGGKQAVFFIGTSVRMISKPKDSTDVHELVISKEEFEKREKNNQSIYTGYIKNRKPGDTSHIHSEEDNLIKLITEEPTRGSFTAVVIQGVNTQHVTYLKQNFKMWTRQLAHIYHFYLHGPDGNKENVSISPDTSPFNNINITVNVHIRGHPNPKSVELRTINDDMQSMFVRTAASTFDFKAYVDGSTAVEGVIRYHPFLYDKETYPSDIYGVKIDIEPEDDHGYAINDRPARGRRPIFETYWNGRLIPYTVIEDFDWCSLPKRQKNIPSECYNRISGVLWTNDSFQVSTNKLTFMDLELKLKDKNTNFVRIVNGHDKRTSIEREFQSWLKECNELYDKQIFFLGNQGQVTRTDLPRHKQIPWTKFSMVEWDGKVYDTGLMVRILRTTPALYGTIQAFYLYGEYEGDIYAMGGDIEILQEPQSLYSERRFVPINKLDRGTSTLQIKKYIEEEESKLPDHLIVTWPNGMDVVQNEKRNAGKTIGDIKVEISNKRGEKISKIPFSAAGTKKLLVELKLIWHASHGDETIVSLVSQHGKTWPYWFRKMDSAKNLGNYTLQLNTVLNESGNTLFAGKELPSYKIKFSVIEADPEKFTVGILDGPFKVGVPFQIPLEFQDKYNNSTRAPAKLKPMLDADGLELSYENTQIKGNSCFIKGVVAKGIVTRSSEKSFNLKVSIPGLEQTHLLKIRLLPGPAANLVVKPETEITIENGSAPTYFLEVQDIAGNITSGTKLNVVAKMMGASGLPIMVIDCSATGTATLVCKPIFIKNMSGEKNITVVFDIQGSRGMSPIERIIRVVPSNRASVIKASYKSGNKEIEIKNGDILELEAGTELNPIMFEVLNEAGEILELDDKLAAKIKVNWAPKSLKDQLQRKCLPPLKVSTSVLEPKYCSISLMEGEGIELQFTVRSLPAPASQLLCELKGESSTLLGEQLQGAILVSMKDKFGNQVPYLNSCKEISCSGDGLKVQELIKTLDNQKCLISNLIFTSMGMKEVEVKWKELKSSVKFEVKAGAPTQLEVLDWVVDEPILVFSGKPLSQPFRVQLLDAEKNPCHLNNVKVQIVRDQKLKLHPAPVFVRTDNLGIADFGVLTITANSGIYDIQPKANIFKTVINGPKFIVNVQPDPLKPSAVEVSYNPKMTITAGQTFPDFTVTVISEDGSLLRSATLDQVSMRLWRKEPEAANAKPEIIQFQASNKEDVGTFSFKKCQVPETSGNYNVMFVYSGGSVELLSIVNTLIVNPGSPAELISLDRRTTPTVSNTKSAASRTLIKSLVLELRDEFHNSLTKGYNGKVKVQITSAKKMDEIPVFVNGDTLREFPLLAGQCTLQNLILQENASGKDGFEYTLSCTVQCELIPKNKPVPPLDIPFLFYNDAKKQQQMASLSVERDTLQSTIKTYKSMFETQQQLIAELRAAVNETLKEEQNLRGELRKQNIPGTQLQSVETVDKLIAARVKEREQVLRSPRRTCSLSPAETSDTDILGKIAHLALVQQDEIARVLSWHMSADMDCVVTSTTQKAKEVYQRTQGRQQVLPLDSIYRKNLPEWDKPLPHIRFQPKYKPAGNPVYARNLLEFTRDEESCRVVFGMLLGDTLILDTLDQANQYRQEIIKYTHCPTILTRSGDRIRSNGKFGGTMNKAPPMDKLKGCVFGQPLPIAYHALCTQIETLEKYKTALAASIQSHDELQEQINLQKDPETLEKYKECKEAEVKLKEVEQKLGMNMPTRNLKHQTSTPTGTEPALKKTKSEQSPATPSRLSVVHPSPRSRNGPSPIVVDPSATPSRMSSRIASMTTVISEDGRKRLKKSL